MKLHLVATVPNEGARRLAWWIVRIGDDAASRLERLAGVSAVTAERLLCGSVLPGAEMGHLLFLVTDGLVRLGDWRRVACGGWFDRPQCFEEQEARGGASPATARAGAAFLPSGAAPAPVREMRG